jgi:hypothetical protein
MTPPTPDDDVEITIRVQPVVARPHGWRGRSSGLIAAGLIGFIAIGVILGTAFKDTGPTRPGVAEASPSSGQPTPGTTESPAPSRTPRATPPAAVEIVGGRIPTEQRFVYANGLEVLDLSTGILTSSLSSSYEQFPATNDEAVCACIVRGTTTEVRFNLFDLTGKPLADTKLLTLDHVVPVGDMTEGFNVVATFDRANDRLFVLLALRRPPVWTVELVGVDATTGNIIDTAVLDTFPVDIESPSSSPSPSPSARQDGSPPDGVYVWAEAITASTNGSVLLASASWAEVRGGNWTNKRSEWMVPIRRGTIRNPIAFTGDAALGPDAGCFARPSFLDANQLVEACGTSDPTTGGTRYFVRRVTSTGESLGDVPLPASRPGNRFPTAILDRPGRRLFVWDLASHELARVGLDDGRVDTSAVSLTMLPPDRRAVDGQGYFGADPGLVLSPDGARLYAIGLGRGGFQSGSTTGVWIFDATTMELVDHWEARALLTSIAISDDGAFVYATGAPGHDAQGSETPWPASLTVYDAATGEIQVVYGAIGNGSWLTFPTWP